MGRFLGDLFIKMSADSATLHRDMTKAARSVKSSTAKMNRNLAKLDRKFYYLQRRIKSSVRDFMSLKTVGAVLGGYFSAKTVKSFVDTNKAFEQMTLKLDALTKGKGVETLEQINKWAIKMPVNTQKAVNTFAMMKAMGLDPTIKSMETLVDVSVLFGEETMPRVARALGQMQTLGRLSAEELNQLSESGINARKYLTEAFGTGVAQEINKSGVAIERIIEVIMKGLEKDFGGAARKSMNTWQGVTSTFKSTVTEIERQFGAAGTFNSAKNIIIDISTEMGKWLDQQIELKNMGLPNWFDSVAVGAQNLADALGTIAKYAGLRSIMGTVMQGAELSKQGRLGIDFKSFLKKGFFERQEIVDRILATTIETGAPIFRGKIPKQPPPRETGGKDTGLDYDAWIKDYTSKLGTFIDYWDDSWLRMDRRVSTVGDDIIKQNEEWEKNYIATLSDVVDYSSDSWMQISQIAKVENEKTVSIVDEAYKNMLENIQGAFADTFYDMFSGQLDSFEDFADSMKNIFFRTLSEMAAKSAMTKLFPSTAAGAGGQAGGLFAGTAFGKAIPYVGAALMGFSVGQMIGKMIFGDRDHRPRYKFDSGWQATAAYMGGEYQAISNIKHHGKGKDITDTIRDMYEGYVEQANLLANIVGPQGTIAFKPARSNFRFDKVDQNLTELAGKWADTLWNAFDDAFRRMGFSSMEAVTEGIEKEQNALGNAFQASLASGSWVRFKMSLAEQIYNTITEDLTQQLIQSSAIQGALMPIYGQIAKGMTAASAGGGFNVGVFGQYATGAASQLNSVLAPIKPAFDAMAGLSQRLKDILVGSFQHGGVVPETGLAMVHKGEHISNGGTVVINADVITTNDVDTWLAERIQRIDTLRVGKKISKVELSTAGLDI